MQSPYGIYKEHAKRGELAYQVDREGSAVFYPRIMDLQTFEPPQWRISAGLGRVYACTVIHGQAGARRNLSLIDLDEGFRMMSRVEDIDPADVCIGMQVRVVFRQPDGADAPLAIFIPTGVSS